MRRRTRNIVLALIGSAGLLTCCVSSCVDYADEPRKDAEGKVLTDNRGHVVTHRRYYYRPWWGWGWSSGWSGSSGGYYGPNRGISSRPGTGSPSARPSSPGTGGGSRSTGTSTTSRGGFGGTGHGSVGG